MKILRFLIVCSICVVFGAIANAESYCPTVSTKGQDRRTNKSNFHVVQYNAEWEAQAVVMQQVVAPYLQKGYEIILMGDLNDWDNQALDANSNKPISQVNEILKGSGTNWTLTNIASKLGSSERYSEWYDDNSDCVYSAKETSMIDHIMVSPGLLAKITNVFIAHSEYQQSCNNFYFSDHWPVVVDFAV